MKRRLRRTRGFILIETTIATAVIGFGLIALVPTFVLCIKASENAEQTKIASQLSTELLEEIRLRRWDELTPLIPAAIPTGSATLGVETGEDAADKRTFEDIDDFNGWTETAPKDPMMSAIAGVTGYTRSVTVSYVTSAMTASATPTAYKQVHVCARGKKMASICVDTLFTNR